MVISAVSVHFIYCNIEISKSFCCKLQIIIDVDKTSGKQ